MRKNKLLFIITKERERNILEIKTTLVWAIVIIICSLIGIKCNINDKLSTSKMTIFILIIIIIITLGGFLYFNSKSSLDRYGWVEKYMEYSRLHSLSKGKTQKIALIDSGISEFQLNNYEKSIVLAGSDSDNNGHGTIMYSIIKGYEEKVLGISPDVEIISIKVMDTEEKVSPNNIIKAIEKAVEEKCTIINLSIGSYKYNKDVSDIIDKAINKGITVVASVGDYETYEMLFPANKDNVISVGSLSPNLVESDFNNAPDECTIIAPGDEIKGVDIQKQTIFTSGTSQATAIISGYVALLKDYSISNGKSLNNEEIISILDKINNKQLSYADALLSIK